MAMAHSVGNCTSPVYDQCVCVCVCVCVCCEESRRKNVQELKILADQISTINTTDTYNEAIQSSK